MQHSIPHATQNRYRYHVHYPNASGTATPQTRPHSHYQPIMSAHALLSSAEESNIFGFLDAFDWDLDESVGAGMPAFDSGSAAGPEQISMDVDPYFNCEYNFIPFRSSS
jgi:hypothetical protein